MKILITGATERIGRSLIPALIDKGHKIRALVIPEDCNKDNIRKMDIEIQEGKLERHLHLSFSSGWNRSSLSPGWTITCRKFK